MTERLATPITPARTHAAAWISAAFLIALLIAYALPWMQVPTVGGLTVGAYDLAEWASIHPAVRAEPLITPLLLRAVLAVVALAFALAPLSRLPRAVVVVLLAAALLPPLEFFTSARGDANYQQQAMLAAATLVLGLAATVWARRPRRLTLALCRLALLLSAVMGLAGALRAVAYFQGFTLNAQVGIGLVLFIVTALVGAALSFRWRP